VQILADSSAYYFGLGDLLREWNELEAAEHHLARGMDLIRGMSSVDEREYLTLARVHIAEERVSPTGTDLSAVLFLLERLLGEAKANMRMYSVVEILLLLALALEVQGDCTGAPAVLEGASNREIAHQLVLSVNTAKKHVLNICGKLNVQSRAGDRESVGAPSAVSVGEQWDASNH